MIAMSIWIKWNENPVGNRVRDCAQRAIASALDVDWDTASDLIYEMAKGMGTTTDDDNAWGAIAAITAVTAAWSRNCAA